MGKHVLVRRVCLLLLLGLFFSCAAHESPGVPVLVRSDEGRPLASFEAELATTAAAQARGLMYRRMLAEDGAMLFVFPQDTSTAFWMKNTFLSLDMIFVGSDKKILSIVHEAEPQTTTPRRSSQPYRYVLEIKGGLCRQWGIREGDRLEFEL